MSKHTDDLSNQQFGKLTAISRIKGTQWLCQCECGETLKVGAYYLKKGRITNCGCVHDLTGKKFGRLTVIAKAGKGADNRFQWKCICECGKEKIVSGESLKKGTTRSCGCLLREKKKVEKPKKYNKFKDCGDYFTFYTNKGFFYIDREDFNWVYNDYYWYQNKMGYVFARKQGKNVSLHRLVMNCPKGLEVDHIKTENKFDNRRSNLRIGTHQENMRNRKMSKANKSGFVGVYWRPITQSWEVKIGDKYLGRYNSYEEAVIVRKDAEKKYFGEWSYEYSQNLRL